jgi:hypothetical protein
VLGDFGQRDIASFADDLVRPALLDLSEIRANVNPLAR